MYVYDYELLKQDLEACNYVYQDFIGERVTADTNHDYKVKLNRYLTPEAKQSKIKKKQLWKEFVNEVYTLIHEYDQRWLNHWRPIVYEAFLRTQVILTNHHVESEIRDRNPVDLPYLYVKSPIRTGVISDHGTTVKPTTADRTLPRYRPLQIDFEIGTHIGLYARKSNADWSSEKISEELSAIHQQALQNLQAGIAEHQFWMGILLEIDQMMEELFQEKQVVWPKI